MHGTQFAERGIFFAILATLFASIAYTLPLVSTRLSTCLVPLLCLLCSNCGPQSMGIAASSGGGDTKCHWVNALLK